MAFLPPASLTYSGAHLGSALSAQRPSFPSPARRRPAGGRGVRMTATAEEPFVPDMAKRRTMNIILFSSASACAVAMLVPFGAFFVPRKAKGGAGAGVVAKDALGNDVKKDAFLQEHQGGSRVLVQGLRGDATYLIATDDRSDLEFYGLNAVCTHLGCVVPWNQAEGKFICPCHGSQYDKTGKVVRGPAPLSLALERVETDEDDNVILKSWKETDFRTGEDPWWNF